MTRTSKLMLIAAVACVGYWVIVFAMSCHRRYHGEQLEWAVVQVQMGFTAAEAELVLGGPPDDVSQTSGVFMNRVTFLTAENSLAANYGESRPYEVHRWQRGDAQASVFIDEKGRVAGGWVTRDQNRRLSRLSSMLDEAYAFIVRK